MKDINITPTAQAVATLGALALVGGAIAAQLPELRRYLKVRAM